MVFFVCIYSYFIAFHFLHVFIYHLVFKDERSQITPKPLLEIHWITYYMSFTVKNNFVTHPVVTEKPFMPFSNCTDWLTYIITLKIRILIVFIKISISIIYLFFTLGKNNVKFPM